MSKTCFTLTSANDVMLECFAWRKTEQAIYKGVIVIVHGMGEHVERYHHFALYLNENNYLVYGYNHRGHKGTIKSDDDYGYIADKDSFQLIVEDLEKIRRFVREEHPDLPIFLFGHSMGSFITQRYVQLYGSKINGIILSGSSKHNRLLLCFGLILARIIRRFKGPRHRSKMLFNLVVGSFNKRFRPNRTEVDWVNSDPVEVDKYMKDKYCGGVFTTSFYLDFLRLLCEINIHYDLVPKELGILIISGSKDPVGGCSKAVTKLYRKFKKMQMLDLEFKLYPEARHELIHEKCKEEVYSDSTNWLNKRIS